MTTLATIELAAKTLAAERADLAQDVAALNDGIAALRKRLIPRIKRRVAKTAEAQAALHALIEDAPDLFVKPRTVVMHGLRIGYAKGKGGISFEDAGRVVELVRKHFPDQFEVLVKTTEKPVKDALANLPAADLKRLGCKVESTGDQVVIRAVDSDVDKLVDALLKGAVETEQEAA